jgi:triosephosphate isomerase
LRVILCVGESAADRDAGGALDVVAGQLRESVPEQGAMAAKGDIVIAYEPVWAIGTGRIPTAAQISDMHRHIREVFEAQKSGGAIGLRVLYGGSVKAENAGDILSIAGVDGALVGGASLSAAGFWPICAHYAA